MGDLLYARRRVQHNYEAQVTTCSLVGDTDVSEERSAFAFLVDETEAEGSSETLIPIYQASRRQLKWQ
jgi:hypothetical protein